MVVLFDKNGKLIMIVHIFFGGNNLSELLRREVKQIWSFIRRLRWD